MRDYWQAAVGVAVGTAVGLPLGVAVKVGVVVGDGVTERSSGTVGVLLGVAQVGSGGWVAVAGSGVLLGASVGTGVLLGGGGVLLGGAGVLLGGIGVLLGTGVSLAGAGVSLGAGGAVTSTVIVIGGAAVGVAARTVTVTTIGSGVSVDEAATVGGSVIVACPLRLVGVLVVRESGSVGLIITTFAVGLGNGVAVADTLIAF